MFTGIVEHKGEIIATEQRNDLRLAIRCPWRDVIVGESVAVSGVCLTATGLTEDRQGFFTDVSAETLRCTAPRWERGQQVNLERALKAGDRLGGHLVSGHVDGLATLREVTQAGGSHVLRLEAPRELARFITAKGSVTLDGVSLTVNRVDGAAFWVNIIPHTYAHTTLGERKPGDVLNLEVDMIARYVDHLLTKWP